ncbi:unnamed protein product [Calicophoron daubneyi]|uniref:Glycosyl hydrolase family 13 catalytic domain-containing protein n=1 Tax=Calicophoron daubneyi TaxID=300641 RepID=A0AAV2TPK7_CALDB
MGEYGRYTPGRPISQSEPVYPNSSADRPHLYGHTLSPEPESAVLTEGSYGPDGYGAASNAMFFDPNSPFFGMDPQLVGFVQKHNVVLDDGAVLNVNALKEKAAMERKQKKKFIPPCGLTRTQFIVSTIFITLLVILIIVALALGFTLGMRVDRPDYSAATPWWRRTQMYQINVATWANDVGGVTGRLADVIPRMAYLSAQISATSIVLNELIANDGHGITNWNEVSSVVADVMEAMPTLIPQLVSKAAKPRGIFIKAPAIQIVLGMPLYATSNMHPWFQQSVTGTMTKYVTYYIWTTQAPSTDQERRYYAYSETRKAYYRHVHGDPYAPLLNLTNVDVQTDLKQVLTFWKEKLVIKGVMIRNSTNVLPEMMASLRQIVESVQDDEFIWFADDPDIDAKMNTAKRVCFFVLRINRRVTSRADDLSAQIVKITNDSRLPVCTPIWVVEQFTEDVKDSGTVHKLAHFLPGNFLMKAGQEVYLTTGDTSLLQWGYTTFGDYATYWPKNINVESQGRDQVGYWRAYSAGAAKVSLLATASSATQVVVVKPAKDENTLAVYRQHVESSVRAYFVVSFQTLNTVVHFQSIFYDLSSPTVEITFDSKYVYSGRHKLGDVILMNNQVLLLYYY